MSELAIDVQNLTKHYRLTGPQESYTTIRDAFTNAFTRPMRRFRERATQDTKFAALDDVSFSVPAGQVLGIVGRNGAGKSTLLKVLAQITEPTSGRVRLRGRIASLLEVGTGFHAELSGRENLYLNGSILGMTRREIERKFDEIVAFAEVEKFIDTPVKRYSSGMYLRLAFSVAAHLDPEILVVDEVLAVGDAAFQNKCLGKMEQVASSGRTVLFVSHNMATVRSLCERCLWMGNGKLLQDGPTAIILESYLQAPSTDNGFYDLRDHPGRNRASITNVVQSLSLQNDAGEPVGSVSSGDPLVFKVALEAVKPIRHPRLMIGINSGLGERLFTVNSELDPQALPQVIGRTAVYCRVPELPLRTGRYTLSMYFGDSLKLTEAIEEIGSFDVTPGDFFGVGHITPAVHGPFLVRSEWHSSSQEPGTGS